MGLMDLPERETTPDRETTYIHRAWARSRPDEDVIDIYVARYETGVTDGTAKRHYGVFDPDEGIIWWAYMPADQIRPYLSINGLVAAVALETVDNDFIHQLVVMGKRVNDAMNDLTYRSH